MRFSPMTIQISKAQKVLDRMIKVSCSRMKQQSKLWHIFWGLWKDGQSIYFSFKTQLQRLTLSLLYFFYGNIKTSTHSFWLFLAELSLSRGQRSPMGKKIWLSMLDAGRCVRLPRHASWGEILDFKHPASFGGKLHGHPDLDKKTTTKPSLSFD